MEIDFIIKDMEDLSLDQSNGSICTPHKLLEIKDLTLQTPRSGQTLISHLDLEIKDKDHLLVMGPSGSGKTSLLRALAGLWRTGTGSVTFFTEVNGAPLTVDELSKTLRYRRAEGVFFLPQRPYMVLGTLRDQLLYPTWTDHSPSSPEDILKRPVDEDLLRVLEKVRLGDMVDRFKGLDSIQDWASVLSLGEQQRLAFARLLLSRPTLVLLDESTSALDESNEAHLYKQIEEAGITYVSIGHRRTLFNFHSQVLCISKSESALNWSIEPINQARYISTQSTPT